MNPPAAKKVGLISGFKSGAMTFLGDIGAFNNFLLLSIVYFIGAGTSALLMRLFAKSIPKKTGKDSETYWTDLDIGGKNPDTYYRPF